MAKPRSDDSRLHVVLLAGGSGTRFWPLSRKSRPKQLLPLVGPEPLLRTTWNRMRKLVPPSRLWVVAPASLADAVGEILPGLREDNLIVEPSPRDTGPAVALANAAVIARDPRAIVGLFPTDHLIPRERPFLAAVRTAVREAAGGSLVCLGVQPDRPATGFGYLKCARKPTGKRAVPVERFVEKPDLARARRFVRSGRYLWNAGMFVWSCERFTDELRRTAPKLLRAVEGFRSGRTAAWARAPRISVDYAVMEGASGVTVVPLDAGWNDVGSWDAAAEVREKSRSKRDASLIIDSPGTVVFGGERVVAVVDVPGVAVVDTPDALLIVSREGSERVRLVVDRLKRSGHDDLL